MSTVTSKERATRSFDSSPILRRAMGASLAIGVLLFVVKGLAYWLTGSVAILSDAAESVVHLAAVGFAAYSLWFSEQPADRNHLYGHEKIGYVSAGFEGALIGLAALYIIFTAARQWILGPPLQQLDIGMLLVAGAGAVNGVLGWYLIRTGSRHGSLIIRANGLHVLTDCVTSLACIAALLGVLLTGWQPLDPLVAIAVAVNILRSGAKLVRQSFAGLMDEVDPEVDRTIREILDHWTASTGGRYHGLRHRRCPSTTWIEVHLLLPDQWSLTQAHAAATDLERQIADRLPSQVVLTTHLEPLLHHAAHHPVDTAAEGSVQ